MQSDVLRDLLVPHQCNMSSSRARLFTALPNELNEMILRHLPMDFVIGIIRTVSWGARVYVDKNYLQLGTKGIDFSAETAQCARASLMYKAFVVSTPHWFLLRQAALQRRTMPARFHFFALLNKAHITLLSKSVTYRRYDSGATFPHCLTWFTSTDKKKAKEWIPYEENIGSEIFPESFREKIMTQESQSDFSEAKKRRHRRNRPVNIPHHGVTRLLNLVEDAISLKLLRTRNQKHTFEDKRHEILTLLHENFHLKFQKDFMSTQLLNGNKVFFEKFPMHMYVRLFFSRACKVTEQQVGFGSKWYCDETFYKVKAFGEEILTPAVYAMERIILFYLQLCDTCLSYFDERLDDLLVVVNDLCNFSMFKTGKIDLQRFTSIVKSYHIFTVPKSKKQLEFVTNFYKTLFEPYLRNFLHTHVPRYCEQHDQFSYLTLSAAAKLLALLMHLVPVQQSKDIEYNHLGFYKEMLLFLYVLLIFIIKSGTFLKL